MYIIRARQEGGIGPMHVQVVGAAPLLCCWGVSSLQLGTGDFVFLARGLLANPVERARAGGGCSVGSWAS